ncbi:MAG: glucosaminidase domain-containing protein, partial [Polaribacter sp.]
MSLKVVFGCFLLLFLASCGSKKKVVNQKNPGVVIVEPSPVKLPSVKQDELIKKLSKGNARLNKYTLAYIRKYAPIA